MHAPALPGTALLLLLLVFSSGCTDVVGDFLATPAPTLAPTTPLPAVAVTERPATTIATPPHVTTIEPVRALPPERKVNLVLTKDRPSSEIHLLYQGGPGEIYVTRIMMRVYFSEMEFREYIMSNGKKPLPGDEIIAPGTRSGDRCEVFVISAGTRYKVMDEPVYGGMYY